MPVADAGIGDLMKAFTILLGLLLALPAFAADAAKATEEKSSEAKPTEAKASDPKASPKEAGKPASPIKPVDEEDEGDAATVRAVPEGWIPNYRFPKKPESDLFSINFGANIYFPQASLNVLIAKRVTIGVMPFYFKYRFQGVDSIHTGGLLTVSAYRVDDLKGLWVFAGIGGSQSKTSFVDGRASGTQPSIVLATSLGYRWRWGHFNAGVSVGAMYFQQLVVSTFHYGLGVLYPAAIYDLGFSW